MAAPVPVGVVGTMPIRGSGVREIGRQLLYSAAWIDDDRKDIELTGGEVGGHPVPLNGRARASSVGITEEHGDYGPTAA